MLVSLIIAYKLMRYGTTVKITHKYITQHIGYLISAQVLCNPSLFFHYTFALYPSFYNYFIIIVENKTPYHHFTALVCLYLCVCISVSRSRRKMLSVNNNGVEMSECTCMMHHILLLLFLRLFYSLRQDRNQLSY